MDHAAQRNLRRTHLLAGWLFAGLLLALPAASPAHAQLGEAIPGPSYYVAVEAIYAGEYRDAERELRRETQRGIRSTQARWIDAICYHTMLGEVLYQQGRNAEALAEFDQACQLLAAYPNWLLRVKPEPIRASANTARRAAQWGQSQRQFIPGDAPRLMQIAIGQLNNADAITRGGVVMTPQYWRVDAAEIVRTSALAMRRRSELLGPLAPHDRLCRELADVLGRGNLAPANHWTGAWIDLERGLAQASIGRLDEADRLLARAAVADGQFDHPLTCVALLEQGRLAVQRGDGARAAQLLAEAGFSAYYYENWDALTESIWLGWMNHSATNGGGVYPPLAMVAAWAQTNRLQHIAVKLRLAEAESYLWQGQLAQASALIEDTARRMGDMRNGLAAIHQMFLQANVNLMQGKPGPGSELLGRALAAQAAASLRNFQINFAGQSYDDGGLSPRIAVDLFAVLLGDPLPADWALHPLDVIAVLQTKHVAGFDRWFHAALARKDVSLALEVAEAAKRRRFLASLPLGGRLAALRTILEAPVSELSALAVLQRQQLLTSYPAYRELGTTGARLYEQLRAGPIVAKDGAEMKPLADRFDAWGVNAEQREQLLLQMALRRVPSSLEFPPLRKTAELQKGLAEGEALVVYHSAGGELFGFLITAGDAHMWQLGDVRRLRTGLGGFLRELGNYNATRTLSMEELQSDRWREAAANTYEAVFAKSKLDLAETTLLTIVPDDVLWYLPFESLVPTVESSGVLADRVPLRYGPTASLAVGVARPHRRQLHTGIVANEFAANEESAGGEEAVQELEQVVTRPVRLPTPLPEPGHLLATLLDELIVFDEVEPARDGGYDWSPLERPKGGGSDRLAKWFALPYGGPDRIVLTGFATAAEQGLKASRRNSSRSAGAQPGSEVFQAVCGLMANGARTILLTRWRTGGRTNFDLVREFVQELPQTAATDAWQRACLLARESPLDASREPRLKKSDDATAPPTADHPFFWAGYLLVDSSVRPVGKNNVVKDQRSKNVEKMPAVEARDAKKVKSIPPPFDQGAAIGAPSPAKSDDGDSTADNSEDADDEHAAQTTRAEFSAAPIIGNPN